MLKKTTVVFALLALFAAGAVSAQEDELSDVPITFPVHSPYSDRFFASEFSTAFSRFNHFFFFNAIIDQLYVPEGTAGVQRRVSPNSVGRVSAAIGGKFPLQMINVTDVDFSGILGVGFALDGLPMAETWNFYSGAGLFVNHNPLDIGLGFFAGWFRDIYRELPLADDGVFRGSIDSQPPHITDALRVMLIPRIGLGDRIFFLDEIGGFFSFSQQTEQISLLTRLAFRGFDLLARQVGVNIYYKQNSHNLLMEQQMFGARFETRNVSVDFGYRRFLRDYANPFLASFEDGFFGRIVYKFRPRGNVPILFSYGFERTFETRHYFGIGFGLSLPDFINDYLIEFAGGGNFRMTASNITGTERQR
ncbi:MAG: hypothetical protein FWG66_13295 [Spirochaetes bacterium]|nr:hypothetical protein [Spirochaetota bacterium]